MEWYEHYPRLEEKTEERSLSLPENIDDWTPLTSKEGDEEKPCGRVTIVETVTYQKCPKSEPGSIASRFTRLTQLKAPPYRYSGDTVGEEWKELDLGRLEEDSGILVIQNVSGIATLRNLSQIPESILAKKIQLGRSGFFSDLLTIPIVVEFVEIPVGETFRLPLLPGDGPNLRIRSISGTAEFNIFVVPR